ncbi:MAG TPA: glycoside hydrolase family 5 protein, partial [Anaerolineales bacterium]|nr:glycoside hydrolase family 5 protein [Anaerolineales bacterium]
MHIVRFGRQSVKLCFVLLLACLLTLGPGSMAKAGTSSGRASGSSKAAPIGFHVGGRYILDVNGVNFIMRGINHPHNWFPEHTGGFQQIKAKGANTVRVVLSSGQAQDWTENSASDVANVIQLCKSNRLVCVLEVHDTTGDGEVADAITLAQAVEYWKKIKSALVGQEAYVLINLGNEPYGNVNAAGWVADTKNAILAMRNAGFQHMLMVDAPNWGQDWQFVMRNNAASIFNTDPLRNTVFSIHMYGVFETAASIQNYLSHFVNAGLPLVIGEFAHFHSDGDPDEDTILASAQANGIGYLGWSWSGNCCDGEYLDMVVNFNPNQETPWGTRIIHGANGILQTSVEAAVYSGDRNPVVSSVRPGKPNPTSAASVNFTVTFSEAVTGVDTTAPFNDFVLTSTGVTGAAITGVSGSGSTRIVTVSTGSGSGTIRLDVVDNGSIKDGTNNALGGPETGNGNYTRGEISTITKPTNVDVSISGALEAQFYLAQNESTRRSLAGINNGPLKITHISLNPMIAAERVIYKVNGVNTSFMEMTGLPGSQLDTIYWLPWYNNVDLDTQLRIANVTASPATVTVTIGDVAMPSFNLAAGESARKSYTGVNAGPVKIQSNRDIVAAERLIYKANGVNTSFTEMMALPNLQLANTYWLPWYNNVDLDTQLRFANVTNQPASVQVFIGGVEMQGSPFALAPGESTRKSFPGINAGPVKIVSTQDIVAAERLIYKVNNINTSFTEMMALPNNQLDSTYWLPWYNNKDL